MRITGEITEVIRGFEELFGAGGSEPEVLVKKKDGKGFTVSADEKGYQIEYGTPTDFFRACALMNYRISQKETSFTLTEAPRFDSCGIMIDVSRNAVLKVDAVKEMIRYMARMGLNRLMLYTEDTYQMEKYPYFGYLRGAYSKEEIKSIVAYGDVFGIETVPCIQTLGHLAMALRWKYAADIRDTDRTLLCDEEKTYEFIEEMIKTARECYHTDKIHIGMDESTDTGTGQYREKFGQVSRREIIERHLGRVIEIVNKYGFKPMMWSDMFFCNGSDKGMYYDPHADLPTDTPEDLSVVFWDYYHVNAEMYESMILAHKRMNRNVVFAGGVWTWMGPAIEYDKSIVTTNCGLTACMRQGIKDVFATLWGDNGAECSVFASLFGLQMYAEYNYAPEKPDDKRFDEYFKMCTGLDAASFRALGVDTFSDEMCPSHQCGLSKQVLHQDILLGQFDKNFTQFDIKAHFGSYLDKLNAAPHQGNMEYYFDYYRSFVKVLYDKCDVGINLTNAYQSQDKQALVASLGQLKVLYDDLVRFHEKSAKVWYRNNKGFGYELLDGRYGCLEARCKRAIERVRAYLNGEITEIEELAAERLFYNTPGTSESPLFLEGCSFRSAFSVAQ